MAKKVSKTPAVYVLHGWAHDANNQAKWDDFFQFSKQAGVRHITWVPLPGLDGPLEEAWGVLEYAQYVASELPDQPAILLGHSFGGQIALKCTQLFPERVVALVLIDSAGMKNISLIHQSKKRLFGCAASIGKRLTHSPKARALLYKLARTSDYQSAPESLRQTMSQVVEYDSRADAATVSVPTLIIWGRNDGITPLAMGKELHHLITNSTLEVLSQARHAPQFTHPSETAALVAAFVAENFASGSAEQ